MSGLEKNFSYIQWKDINNVQDRMVYSFGLIIQKMRTEVTKLINTVGTQASFNPLRQSNFVFLMVLFRLRESMLSIELLVSKGFARDAAILILSLIELRMEMEYIEQDSMRADDWIIANKKHKSPWKISLLIKELFPDQDERKTEKANYEHFKNMAYTDPMGDQASFPIKEEPDPAPGDDLAVCLFCEGSECYRILKAAVKDLAEAGFDIKSNEKAIEELHELNKKLQTLRKTKPEPAIRNYFPGE